MSTSVKWEWGTWWLCLYSTDFRCSIYMYISKERFTCRIKVTQSYPSLAPTQVHNQVARYQLAVGFACCELRSQHDKPNVLLYCVPSMSVSNKAHCFVPVMYLSFLESFKHNPGFLSTVTSPFMHILFKIRESMTSQRL